MCFAPFKLVKEGVGERHVVALRDEDVAVWFDEEDGYGSTPIGRLYGDGWRYGGTL